MPDRLPFAKLQFSELTDTQLANYGQAVVDGLGSVAGLALYPTPPYSVALLTTAVNNFVAALAAAADGGKAQTAAKDAAKLVLQGGLRANVRYVTQVAQAGVPDYATIRSNIYVSGYQATEPPVPLSVLPQPEINFAQSTGIGLLEVQLKSQKGATAYLAYYKKSSESVYVTFVSTSSRFKIRNLESAVVYDVYFDYKGTTNTVTTITDVMQFTIL